MRYFLSPDFEEGLNRFAASRKDKIKKAIRLAVAFFETGDLPHGLGLKSLGHDLWEIRAGLSDRIIFRRNNDAIEFLLVGSHDEIKRFLKRF